MKVRKAYVHLAYGLDADKYREKYHAGLVPDETPYGFHHAEQMGWQILFSLDHPLSTVGNFVRRGIIWTFGFDLIHAYQNRRFINEADVVWTMEEVEFLAISALPLIAPWVKKPWLIAQTVWLFDKWDRYNPMKRCMLGKLIRRTDVLTVHSKQYLEIIPQCLPGMSGELLYFGISLDSFPWTNKVPELHNPVRVLSMGGDRTREWSTLLEALGNDDQFDVKIVCSWLSDEEIGNYSNVMAPRNPTMASFQALYDWADIVVLPMVPNLYSGITVALEATSRGVPVISSETGGIPTYFSGDEVVYVPPLDVDALRVAVTSCDVEVLSKLIRNAQMRFKREDYSSRGMAKRYVELSERLLGSTKQR